MAVDLCKPSMSEFFGLLTEHSLPHAGVYDPVVHAYVHQLLVGFARAERLHSPFAGAADVDYRHASDVRRYFLGEGDLFRRALVIRHFADWTLFMLGILPEYLEGRGQAAAYSEYGRKSYLSVAGHHRRLGAGEVYEALGHQFDRCVAGLNEMRENHLAITEEDRIRIASQNILLQAFPEGL